MSEGLGWTLDKSFLVYCKEVGNHSLLSTEEELQLLNKAHSDDIARQRLIEANLRLVMKVAKGYKNLGLEMADLISEGNIGLMRAVEKFDSSKGTKFSTYACYWIKQAIKRALSNKSRTIRLPVHLTQLYYSVNNFIKDYEIEHGQQPTDKQIAECLKVSVEKIKKVKAANLLNNFTYLDEKFHGNGEKEKINVIKDYSTQSPSELAVSRGDTNVLREEIIKNLDEREQDVIRYRFGLDNVDCCTLEQLGMKYGITRERIRQIESEALKKLRRRLEVKI